MKFDLIVIGSGPGGYVAAIRASQLGLKTAIVEREHLGGICLNWGCIPTKALLRSAEVYDLFRHATDFGLAADNVRFDARAVVQRSRDVSQRLNRGVAGLLKKNDVTVIWGEATLTAPGRVKVTETSRPARRPQPASPSAGLGRGRIFGRSHHRRDGRAPPNVCRAWSPTAEGIWSYFEAMTPEQIPDSLLVVGSGAIGIEFASFYRTMGAKVTVVEVLDQILPAEDAEIASAARKQFEKQGIAILTSARVDASQERRSDGRFAVAIARRAIERRRFSPRKSSSPSAFRAMSRASAWKALGVEMERGCIVIGCFWKDQRPGPLRHRRRRRARRCWRTRRSMRASFASRPSRD